MKRKIINGLIGILTSGFAISIYSQVNAWECNNAQRLKGCTSVLISPPSSSSYDSNLACCVKEKAKVLPFPFRWTEELCEGYYGEPDGPYCHTETRVEQGYFCEELCSKE